MKKTLLGILSITAGVGVFYGCFFKLAPWITSLFPVGSDWTPLLKVVSVILIAWMGGIVIPIALVVLGVSFFLGVWSK